MLKMRSRRRTDIHRGTWEAQPRPRWGTPSRSGFGGFRGIPRCGGRAGGAGDKHAQPGRPCV